MRKPHVPAILGLALLSTGLAASARAEELNGSGRDAVAPKRLLSRAELVERIRAVDPGFDGVFTAGSIGCAVEDAFGNPVTTVPVLEQMGEPAFWLQYLNDGGLDREVRFILVPRFEGSPLATQQQVFTPNDACNIVTPFGIPFFGLDETVGPWVLVIRNNRGGAATCRFEVVPAD